MRRSRNVTAQELAEIKETVRQVTATRKDRYGQVIGLCGDFGYISEAQAIRNIRAFKQVYYTEGPGRVWNAVRIVSLGSGREGLRTKSGTNPDEQLRNLPDC